MKLLLAIGLILIVAGGAMLAIPSFGVKDEHTARIGGLKLSVTETDRKSFPPALAWTLLGVGAVMSVAAAAKWPKDRKV